MGMDFDQLNAVVGTVTAATKQSGREIGNFVKAVLPRLVGQPAQDALKSLDISLTDHEGNLRDIIQVYTEVAHAVKGISDADRIAVTEGLAGKFHIARMQALLDDLGSVDSMYRNIYESSVNSAGSALEENEEYMKSLEARMNLARVEVEKLALAMGEAFLTEGMVQGIQVFSDFLTLSTKVVDSIGALPVAFGLLNAALFLSSTRYRTLLVAMTQGTAGMTAQRTATIGLSTGMKAGAASATLFSGALRSILLASGVGVALVALGFAVEALIGKMAKQRELTESIAESSRLMTASYSENTERVNELADSYSRLENIAKGGNIDTETAKEYLSVQNELATLMPELKAGEDGYGNAVLVSSSAVQGRLGLLESQIKLENELKAIQSQIDFQEQVDATEKLLKDQEYMFNQSRNILSYMMDINEKDLSDNSIADYIKAQEEEIARLEDRGSDVRAERLRDRLVTFQGYLDEMYGYELKAEQSRLALNQSGVQATVDAIQANERLTESSRNTATQITLTFSAIAGGSTEASEALGKIGRSLDPEILNSYTGALEEYQLALVSGTASEEEINSLRDAANAKLEELRENILRIAEAVGVEKGSQEWIELNEALTSVEGTAFNTSTAIEGLSDATGRSKEEITNALIEGGLLEEGYDALGNAAEGAAGKTYELRDAIDHLSGMSQQQIDDTEDLMWQYELIENQLASLTEGTEEYDRATDNLNAVKEELLKLYPHLFDAGVNALNMTEAQIDAIREEIHANDIYRSALKASRDGKLTADEDRALSGLKTAREEIHNINEQIKALNKLALAYGAQAKSLSTAASAARLAENFAPGAGHLAVGLEAASKAMENRYENATGKISTYEAQLSDLQKTQRNYIDTLERSEAVLGNTTTRGNKARNDAAKASKKAADAAKKNAKAAEELNKEVERSIYLADTYKQALERLNLELSKVKQEKDRATKGSKEHQNAIKKEIELLETQMKLNKENVNSLKEQIRTGNIARTGIVKTSSSSYSGKYASEINAAASKYGVDPNLIVAVIQAESNFNPNARSSAGAQGLMQLMPATARGLGVKNSYDPAQNIMGGTKYLADQLKAFGGDIKMALAAYNAGPGNVRKYGGIPPFKETQNYIKRVTNTLAKTANVATTAGNIADYYLGSGFRLTSGFGPRNTGIKGASTNHQGIDLAAKAGTSIKSLRDGKVVASYYHNAQGHVIRVQQDDGIVAQYQHMQGKSALKVGQSVTAGQEVGKVGSTGVSSGPHLHLEIKQNGQNIDPAKYLQEQGKLISSSTQKVAEGARDIDQLRSDLTKTEQDMLATQALIQSAYMELVESEIARFENLIAGVDRSISKVDKTLIEYSKTSDGYREALQKQVKHMEYKQQLMHKEANYMREELKNDNLSAAMKADLTARISDLGLAWLDVRDAIKSVNMEIIQSRLSEFSDKISGVDKSLEKIGKQLQYYEEGGFAYLEVLKEQIKHYEYKQSLLKKQEDYLRGQLKNSKLTKDQIREIEIELSNVVLSWWDVENAISGVNDLLKDQTEKLSDDLIDSMKAVYEHRKQMALQAIDAEIKAEEERHSKQMKHYEDELKAYEKVIQAKLREIDDKYDEDQYEKELRKMQEERLKLQKEIDLLAMDDSFEATAKRADLEKQLADQMEKISDFQADRERKLRKDSLNGQLEDYKEDIEAKKEAEDEKYKSEIDRLKELRKQEEYHYNEILKNERKWSAIREDIRNGEIGKHKEFLNQFLDEFENMNEESLRELQNTFYEVGMSFQELLNLIDRVKDAGAGVGGEVDIAKPPSGERNVIEHMKKNSSKWQSASTSERLQIEKENQILGKQIGASYDSSTGVWHKDGRHLYHSDTVQDAIDTMKDNASKWSSASPSERKRLEEYNERLGKAIGASYNSSTGIWYKDGLRLYHEGGIVGDKPINRATELANKLFNASPNEQVVKALKGELMIPPQNIPNIFDNISNLMKTVSPPSIGNMPTSFEGGDIIVNFNIDKMTGDDGDVRKFSDKFMNQIKRNRGGKF